MAKVSQKQILVDYLRGTGRTLTASEAKDKFGIKNLAARMKEICDYGLKVKVKDSAYRIAARDVYGSRAKLKV